jgi:hypothetical protein
MGPEGAKPRAFEPPCVGCSDLIARHRRPAPQRCLARLPEHLSEVFPRPVQIHFAPAKPVPTPS